MTNWFLLSLAFTFGWILRYFVLSRREARLHKEISDLEKQLNDSFAANQRDRDFYLQKIKELSIAKNQLITILNEKQAARSAATNP